MQVNSLNVAGVFANGGNIFYILPYFQREYAWTKENGKSLLTDVQSIYVRARTHFLANRILNVWPSIGDVPPPPPTGTKPRAVIFLGETFPAQTWRDVAFYTAEAISQVSDNFEAIATQMPSYFSKEQFKGTCRQLSNGWWLYVNLSSNSVRSLCQRLLDSANISDEDWQLEEE